VRHPFIRSRTTSLFALLAALLPLFVACQLDSSNSSSYVARSKALAQLTQEPINAVPWVYTQAPGLLITTDHFHIYTTIQDPLYQRLLIKTLEGAYARSLAKNPGGNRTPPLVCYIFASRAQWEHYTRERAGSNAPTYLLITAGGYCQDGIFAGFDIGRSRTLSVIAHESWHQYSWFSFKDRLPSWLEEGLATQNEGLDWDGATPIFKPQLNHERWMALKTARREQRIWKIEDLISTHAGLALAQGTHQVDAYYAQLWSFTLFLQHTPKYNAGLDRLLADATQGTLARTLGNSVSRRDIDNFTERWNAVAGPAYMRRYISADLPQLQREYEAWLRNFALTWPPKLDAPK